MSITLPPWRPRSPGWRIALLIMLAWPVVALAGEPLVLNTASAPPLRDHGAVPGFQDQLIREAFQRLGIAVEIITLPAERALLNANAGIDDGNLIRVAGLDSLYRNLRMVPEAVMVYDFVAFAQRDDIAIRGWQSLAPHSVGIIKGWKIVEANLPPTSELIHARNPRQVFRLLAEARVDVVIYEAWQGAYWIHTLGLDANIHELQPPLAREPMFAYLHERHSHLIPRLTRVLRAMKADGSYWRIARQTLCELRPEWKHCDILDTLEAPVR